MFAAGMDKMSEGRVVIWISMLLFALKTYIYIYIYTYIHTYIYIYIHTNVYIYIYTHMLQTYVCIYIYIHISPRSQALVGQGAGDRRMAH